MTLTQLEYVLAVDRFRNFTEAAKSCHVTQPSLSMQIQKLEETLGVVLFDRSQNPILPTEIGKKVIEQARSILGESKRMIEMIREEKDDLKGEFKLGIIPTVAPYLLPLFIESFAKHYPKINLTVTEDQTAHLLKQVEMETIDAAILAPTETMSPSLQTTTLFFEPFVVFASPEHELVSQKTLDSKALPKKGLWLLEEGHCLRDQVLQICQVKDRKNEFAPNVIFQSGSLETLIHLIQRHDGYTMLPGLATLYMSGDEKNRMIREFRDPVPARQISMVFSRVHLKRKMIQSITQEIDQAVPKEFPRMPSKTYQIKIPR